MSLVKSLYRTLLRGIRVIDRDALVSASMITKAKRVFDREHHKWETVKERDGESPASKRLNEILWDFNGGAQFHFPSRDGKDESAESILRTLFRTSDSDGIALATQAVRTLPTFLAFSRLADSEAVGHAEESEYAKLARFFDYFQAVDPQTRAEILEEIDPLPLGPEVVQLSESKSLTRCREEWEESNREILFRSPPQVLPVGVVEKGSILLAHPLLINGLLGNSMVLVVEHGERRRTPPNCRDILF